MTASLFEVPNDLRDFAERSVEQARKAFEGFLAVAQRTAGVAGEAVPGPALVGRAGPLEVAEVAVGWYTPTAT